MFKISSLYFGTAAVFAGITVAYSMAIDPVNTAIGATGTVYFGLHGFRIAMEEVTTPITAQLEKIAKLVPQVPATQTGDSQNKTPEGPNG